MARCGCRAEACRVIVGVVISLLPSLRAFIHKRFEQLLSPLGMLRMLRRPRNHAVLQVRAEADQPSFLGGSAGWSTEAYRVDGAFCVRVSVANSRSETEKRVVCDESPYGGQPRPKKKPLDLEAF